MKRIPLVASTLVASLVASGLVYAFVASSVASGSVATAGTASAGTATASAASTSAASASASAAGAGAVQPSATDLDRAGMWTASPSPSVSTPAAASGGASKLLFGIGTEATGAETTRLVKQAPARMLTSWYNKPEDLSWMTGWRTGIVPRSYAGGYAMHLVVFSDSPEETVNTSYGSACGRTYPLSDRFLEDMRALARTFAGAAGGPPLYVTLFTEVQTYACTDNTWNPDARTNAYYRALKDRYLAAMSIFHAGAANAKVSLGWGGWMARVNDAATGAGRSMFDHFADVMRASDFQSFQAMQGDTNVDDVKAMVRTLGAYGPVMLAHYKPDNGSQSTFDRDVRTMLTDAYLGEVMAAGLFAWSFMDDANLTGSGSTYQFVLGAVARYGTSPGR